MTREDFASEAEWQTYLRAMESAGAAATKASYLTANNPANRPAYTPEDLIRSSAAGTDIASTQGVVGPDGGVYTNSPAVETAIQTGGMAAPSWSRKTLDFAEVERLLTPVMSGPGQPLYVPPENMAEVQRMYQESYGPDWKNEYAKQHPSIDTLHPGSSAPVLSSWSKPSDYSSSPDFTWTDVATGFNPLGPALKGDVEGAAENALLGPGAEKLIKGAAGSGGLLGNPDTPSGGLLSTTSDSKPSLPTGDGGVTTPGGGGGSQGGGGGGGPFTPLNREDFTLQKQTQPWVSPEADALRTYIAEQVQNYPPGEAPVMSTGTPEAIAAYQESLKQQQWLSNAVGQGAVSQSVFADSLGADRGMYRDAALGRVPSVAELQGQQQLGLALRNQLALARTARNPGGAYTAALAGDELQSAAIRDSQLLRAREIADAKAAYNQFLGTTTTALGEATRGAATAATAQSQITQVDVDRLAQEIGVSREQASMILRQRELDATTKQNLINSGINAEGVRTTAMGQGLQENMAALTGTTNYGKTLAEQELGKYTVDVNSQTSKDLAQGNREAQEKAAIVGGITEMGGRLLTAATSGDKGSAPSATATPTATPTSTPTTTMTPENLEEELQTGWETQEDYPSEEE